MSIKLEKSLAEAEWKKFAKGLPKGLDLDDAPLLTALARLGKVADADKADEMLDALDEVEAQLKKQNAIKRKVDSKVLRDQLDDMQGAVPKQRKAAQALKDAAANAEEEEESPALLTTKMAPLIRQLRQGEAEQLKMHTMICTAGKATAVLIMRKSISPARRKLLAEAVDAAGGAKYIVGECGFENKVLTFVVKAPGGALAKRLRQALMDQLALRLKVRVRGEDGAVEEDGEDAGDEQSGVQSGVQSAAPGSQPQAPVKSEAQRAYEARWAALEPRLAAALRAQHPESTKLRAVSGFASEKAAAEDHVGAGKALDMVDKLLGAMAQPTPQQPPPEAPLVPAANATAAFTARLAALMPRIKVALAEGGERGTQARELAARAGAMAKSGDVTGALVLLDELTAALDSAPVTPATPQSTPTGGGASIVQLQKSRLAWDGLRKRLQGQLKELEQALLAGVRQHNNGSDAEFSFDEGALAGSTNRLYGILEKLDTRLIDTLDEALNAEGEARLRIQREAAGIVAEYRRVVDTDPFIAVIDDNGFVPTSIRSETQRTLDQLAAQL